MDFEYWFGNIFVGLRNKMDFNDFGFKICGTNFIIWVSLVLTYGNEFYGFELAIYKYTSIIYLAYEMISRFYYSNIYIGVNLVTCSKYLILFYFPFLTHGMAS